LANITFHLLQKDVDREFFLLFSVLDENLSWYLEQNIETYDTNESDSEDLEFQESNKMHGIYTHLTAVCLGYASFWCTYLTIKLTYSHWDLFVIFHLTCRGQHVHSFLYFYKHGYLHNSILPL